MLVVLGAGGQVGRELTQACAASGIPVRAISRQDLDITKPQHVRMLLGGASILVNCAAYTNVDRAEAEPDRAWAVNCSAVGELAGLCAEIGAALIHLSTDYVFDGRSSTPWRPDDAIAPLSTYGRSKAAGEVLARTRCRQHIILRTSWVFAAHGRNFVKTMLGLAAKHRELRVVDDQWGAPTAASDIAACIVAIARRINGIGPFDAWGTYHFASRDATTWHGFARAIFDRIRWRGVLRPIPTEAYPTPAHRPRYSVLDCSQTTRHFGVEPPDWTVALDRVLVALNADLVECAVGRGG